MTKHRNRQRVRSTGTNPYVEERFSHRRSRSRGEAALLFVMGVMMIGGMLLMATVGGHHMMPWHGDRGKTTEIEKPSPATSAPLVRPSSATGHEAAPGGSHDDAAPAAPDGNVP